MADAKGNSFSVSSNSQRIDKTFSNTSVTWKVDYVRSRYLCAGPIDISPIFQFSNKSWELIIYSCGYVNYGVYDKQIFIRDIHLTCVDINSSSTCTVYFPFSFISDEKRNILRNIIDENRAFCFDKDRNSIKIIDGFYLNKEINSFTLSLNICSEESTKEISLANKVSKVKKKERLLGCSSKLFSDFEKLYENRQLSDVTLKLDKEEFPAHKSVLSARSKVFAAMFEHDMKENLQGTVDLVQMEADTVQDMLRYIYCAKVRELSSTEALNLYIAADRYDLPELGDFCREVITTDISVNNVFDIAAVADIRNDELLIKELKSFMAANGKDMINNDKWKEVFSHNPILLAKMLEWSLSGK